MDTYLIVFVVTVISSSSSRIDKPLKAEKEDTNLEEEIEEELWSPLGFWALLRRKRLIELK